MHINKIKEELMWCVVFFSLCAFLTGTLIGFFIRGKDFGIAIGSSFLLVSTMTVLGRQAVKQLWIELMAKLDEPQL